jgi:hypothetical protein
MPRVNWGITQNDIDQFDREAQAQYAPYTGIDPPAGKVFCFTLKSLKHVDGTEPSKGQEGKWPQLRAGLSLEPRNQAEADYEGYFIMHFMTIAPAVNGKKGTAFQYVPFLDALGVTEQDFMKRTHTDEDGKVTKIGPWINEGDTLILARLKMGADFKTGAPRLEVDWVGEASGVTFEEYESVVPTEDDAEDFDDADLYDDDEDA